MPNLRLEVRQFTSTIGKTYLFYRYYDDNNRNYEYQVYELVQSRDAARDLGALSYRSGRTSELNTREMCDWVFNNN